MKKIFYLLSILALCSSCELNEFPESSALEEDVFGTEGGLRRYSISFYNDLPSSSDAYRLDQMSDYGAVNNLDNFLKLNAYTAQTSSGWDWKNLRNINHFLASNNRSNVSETSRNHYNAVARFFRAYFYYKMVTRFGDVPWVDKALSITDNDILYGDRGDRTVVMDHILADLDYAYANIQTSSSTDGSEITKWTALGLKTRIALFEASFRKYHTELGLASTANKYYKQVVDAAQELMTKGPHSIYTAKGPELSQRQLFVSDAAVTQEVMLAITFNKNLAILSSANWYWTSPTYGPRYSFVRPFINTILNRDGTPYTNRTGYNTQEFYDECQNRDYRLSQLIRTPGYKIDGKPAAPNFNGYSYTGYQPIKYTLDESKYDNGQLNTNAIPLMRYAEVLLNYAEARAELGEITDGDWQKTIGALRSRAGITGGTSQLPTVIDTYIKEKFFKDIDNPVLLEIRRERQVELALEGFRFNDLKRWNAGHIMASLEWSGIYIPELDKPMDLDRDGNVDVIFYDGNNKGPSVTVGAKVAKIAIGGPATNYQTLTADKHLEWFKAQTRTWYDDGRQYYYPIPSNAIVLNKNLKNYPFWQ
ncbi:RagB/SusD family nutrient uptake outer membrane protein [Sphingobacterium anhuiense]|uniref:RagB/SusD family nutrient uptake outer membrane protein n=1 Tax=Sphingobacterium anhuiense TaxID=493780 RepID=UPI003C2F12A3